MRGINVLAMLVREIATDLVIDQIEAGDIANATKNAKLIRSCNTVALLAEQDYAKHVEAVADVYSMAVIWELIK